MSGYTGAIRFVNYMGDYDDLHEKNLIGPFPDAATLRKELRRLSRLPLGGPELNGGYEFEGAKMDKPRWGVNVVAPEQVAKAETVKQFFAAYWGYDEETEDEEAEPDEPPVHPDQGALFAGGVS